MRRRVSLRRTQDATALILGRDNPQRAVRRLRHVTDAPETKIEALLARHPIAIDHKPHDRLRVQARDQQIPAPGKQIADVEFHAAGSDHRIPIIIRLLKTLALGDARIDGAAAILDAV